MKHLAVKFIIVCLPDQSDQNESNDSSLNEHNKQKRNRPHKLNDLRGMVTLQFAICQVTLRQLETFAVI